MSQTISQEFTSSCNENNLYDNKCNKLLLKKELLERQELSKNENEDSDTLEPESDNKQVRLELIDDDLESKL